MFDKYLNVLQRFVILLKGVSYVFQMIVIRIPSQKSVNMKKFRNPLYPAFTLFGILKLRSILVPIALSGLGRQGFFDTSNLY